MSCVPRRRGEKGPRGMEVGDKADPWWGRVFAGPRSREMPPPPPPSPGGSKYSLPGLRPAPAQPLPCGHLRILVGRRAGLPRGPRKDSREMLWHWAVVWLGQGGGERAVHRAPSPTSGGGPN